MTLPFDQDNRQQMLAYKLIEKTNKCMFLTGKAGTGKTFFLQNIQDSINKNFVVLAPTGAAAINAGGQTIHSFFGLPMDVCKPDTCGSMSQARILTLLHTDTVIIDEVSMVRCDIIDAIDCTLRKVMRNELPFGGKQIVFIGDMFQLPPVVCVKAERMLLHDIYQTDSFYFYKANAMKRINLIKIEFTKIYRQTDKLFMDILDNVRMNCLSHNDVMILNEHVGLPQTGDDMIMTLTTRNDTADGINKQRLQQIDSNEYLYEGSLDGEFNERGVIADKRLRLKVGAQVMLLRNDCCQRWANGTLGVVCKLSEDEIFVTMRNGNTYSIPRCTWFTYKYEYDKEKRELKKEATGSFTQFPIRLAWAITIHKSQGLTFDKMILNIDRGIFVPGQFYVALSRLRTLAGLYLSRPVSSKYANTSNEIITFSSDYTDESLIQSALGSSQSMDETSKCQNEDETIPEIGVHLLNVLTI